jgi:uncharacterized delta-60 repeat protein
LARVWADGSRDGSFVPPAGEAYSIVVQDDGRIVFPGGSRVYVGGDRYNPVYRVNGDGSQDSSFAVRVRLNGRNDSARVWAQAVQADGKILLGGTFNSVGNYWRTNLARLNPDGTVDETFDPGTGVRDERYDGVYCLARGLYQEQLVWLRRRRPVDVVLRSCDREPALESVVEISMAEIAAPLGE